MGGVMRTVAAALVLAAGMMIGSGAGAQSFPAKPVRAVIPITPGSGLDIVGRLISQKLGDAWGQPVIIENRPGAGTTLGTAVVAKAPADGHTLLVSSNAHAMSPSVYTKLPYDPLKDFVAVAPLARLGQVLVIAPSVGFRNAQQLIAAAKANPGKLTFASAGTGGGVHFTGEKFKLAAGIDVLHVPYKGGPEAMTDVMMGRVTYWIPSIGTALPFIKDGKLLALGVTTRERASALPDVPSLAELGVAGFEDSIWFGVWAPAGTPFGVVGRIARDIASALALPDMRGQLARLAAEPMSMTPAEFARFVRAEMDAAARVAKIAGITPQ